MKKILQLKFEPDYNNKENANGVVTRLQIASCQGRFSPAAPIFNFFRLELGHLYTVAGYLQYLDRSICSFSFCQHSAGAGIKYL